MFAWGAGRVSKCLKVFSREYFRVAAGGRSQAAAAFSAAATQETRETGKGREMTRRVARKLEGASLWKGEGNESEKRGGET